MFLLILSSIDSIFSINDCFIKFHIYEFLLDWTEDAFPQREFFSVFLYCFIFLNVFIFNWRIIALQYYIGFYQISTWISHRFTQVPSHLNILPPPSPSHPSRLLLSPGLCSLSHTACSHWLSILHMVMYVSMFLSPYLPPSPSSPSKEGFCFLFWI